MKRIAILSLLAAMLLVPSTNAVARGGQWSKEKAAEWYASQKWPVGCNYVPSYAINQYEIWQPETFNPEIIDNELSLAESIGFNTLRIYLHEGLWYADKVGFRKRIDQFLDIADKHGMKLIITFFTNGGNRSDVLYVDALLVVDEKDRDRGGPHELPNLIFAFVAVHAALFAESVSLVHEDA